MVVYRTVRFICIIYNKLSLKEFVGSGWQGGRVLKVTIFFSAKEQGDFSSIFNHKPGNVKGFLTVFLYICPFIK